MRGLDGKVAIVTGGARGMGRAITERLVEEGVRVLVADLRDEETAKVAASLGGCTLPHHLDVTDPGGWAGAVTAAVEEWGRLDILVNNAGICLRTPLAGDDPAASASAYAQVVAVNQTGPFLGVQAVVPAMSRSGGGSIVNISSMDGFVGVPGISAYISSKFAIRGLTKVAALELAPHGIRVNSVHPGYVDTPMLSEAGLDAASLDRCAQQIPLGRVGSVSDIAAAVAFLASDDSAYCSGTELLVDGALLAGRRLAGEGLH
jgi:3alpha(or 20beta)-hydroxysteroid dehydrogenase